MINQSYVHPVSKQRYGVWAWCLRCERVYRTVQWFANHWFCPHPGCDGTARHSSRWRYKNEPPCDVNPHYPAVPVEGQRYAGVRAVTVAKPALTHSPRKPIWAFRVAQRAKSVLQARFGQAEMVASR